MESLLHSWKEILELVSVVGLIVYFWGVGLTFLFNPKNGSSFAVSPIGKAGITEIRVYYGAFSLAVGSFLTYLLFCGLGSAALVGGLFFSTFVLVSRTIFTTIDGGWKEPYTKLAIPAETVFAVLLWAIFLTVKLA